MWHRLWKPSVIVLPWAAFVLAVLYIAYRLVDPLPPRHLAIAAGAAILICCVTPLLGCRRLSPPSASRNRVMRTSSIHSMGFTMQRYSFFTGTPSQLRNLRNSVASAFPLACRELRYDRLSC